MYAPEVANEVVYKCAQLLGATAIRRIIPWNVSTETCGSQPFLKVLPSAEASVAKLMGLRGKKKV